MTTLATLPQRQAERYGRRTALLHKQRGGSVWHEVSWQELALRVRATARALAALGVEPQERVAVMAQNMPECLYVDFGAYALRAVTVPLYATSSEAQVRYIVTDADVRFVFVGEQEQYDVAFRVLQIAPCMRRIIIFSRSVTRHPQDLTSVFFDDFIGDLASAGDWAAGPEPQPDDIANILYTSGTTGLSKGVVITHRMYNTAIANHRGVLPIGPRDVSLMFLPLTHVFERGWTYLCLTHGVTVALNLDPQQVRQSMQEIKPTCMCAVPRFWEKVYDGAMEIIDSAPPMQRRLMMEALAVGHEYNIKNIARGLTPPLALKLRYKFFERTVYSIIYRRLGLERHNVFPCAGAAVPPVVEDFVRSIGLRMVVGYGMTETTATVSLDRLGQSSSVGSVGRLMPGLEIKFAPNGEILLRGQTITPGYYRKAEVTALTIDAEGWLHTGDAGYMKDGELYLTERIKDLMKTSNGKYIAPQALEAKLCVDRYIDQIVIIADGRRFVSALVVPNYALLQSTGRRADEQTSFLMERIDTLQQELAPYERVKRIALLPEPLSMARGELTNTLKVKRAAVAERYRDLIDKMYQT